MLEATPLIDFVLSLGVAPLEHANGIRGMMWRFNKLDAGLATSSRRWGEKEEESISEMVRLTGQYIRRQVNTALRLSIEAARRLSEAIEKELDLAEVQLKGFLDRAIEAAGRPSYDQFVDQFRVAAAAIHRLNPEAPTQSTAEITSLFNHAADIKADFEQVSRAV